MITLTNPVKAASISDSQIANYDNLIAFLRALNDGEAKSKRASTQSPIRSWYLNLANKAQRDYIKDRALLASI